MAYSDLTGFAQLTGDRNPIHLSVHFATKTSFQTRIAHRLYTASLISVVLGRRLSGPSAVYISQPDPSVGAPSPSPVAELMVDARSTARRVLDGGALVKVPSARKRQVAAVGGKSGAACTAETGQRSLNSGYSPRLALTNGQHTAIELARAAWGLAAGVASRFPIGPRGASRRRLWWQIDLDQ